MSNATGITSLRIQRFRGIADGLVEGLVDVNVLVGRNNSGKSTILEALHLLSGWVVPNRGADPLGRFYSDTWLPARGETGFPPENLWYRGDRTLPIVLGGMVEQVRVETVFSSNGRVELSPKPLAPAVLDFLSRACVFRPKDLENRNAEKINWSTILRTRQDVALVQSLNEVFEFQAEQYQLLPDGNLMMLFPQEGIPLDLQGDGVRMAFRALTIAAVLRKTVLMLEEPECYLHPDALRRYARALCGWARRQEVQLMLTTHSRECVKAFVAAAEVAGSGSAVHHVTLQGGKLETRRIEPADFRALESADTDVRLLDQYV